MTRRDRHGLHLVGEPRFDCGVCLDFGHLSPWEPCPWCRPDEHTEYLAELAAHARAVAAEEAGQ